MNMNDLFSAKTRKSLQLREDWMRKLFSNTSLEPIHKLVMVALTFWYFPENRNQEDGRTVMDYSELAELIGMPEDETEEAVLTLVKAGALGLTDEQGHELDVVTHYTCNDCGNEWHDHD